jgi:flagellar L-ring protein precursor FlgH
VDNNQNINIRAITQKQYTYVDTVSCQVVQVLPNGFLVVQGRKSIFANQERQDLYITGIVNPFYLNSRNTISSNQVANLQMNVVGKGPLTRQQGDGVLGKYFQFMN